MILFESNIVFSLKIMNKKLLFLSICFFLLILIPLPIYGQTTNENSQAQEWILENATEPIFLQKAEEYWSDDYFMIKVEYQRQAQAYEWLVNNDLETNPPVEGEDYYELMLKHQRENAIQQTRWQSVILAIASILFISILQFFIYLKDMISRKEKIFFWGFIFLLTGPIGLTFYLSYRKLKKQEKRTGRKLHHLSKNFIPSWAAYIIGGGIIIISLIIGYDYFTDGITDFNHIMEAIFWFGLIFAVFIVPFFIILPISISFVIMLFTKEK